MFRRLPWSRGAGPLLAAVVFAIAGSGSSAAPVPDDPIVATGSLDYDALAPGDIVESITANTAELTFSTGGGPFTATVALDLAHDVPARGCRFVSTHRWDVTGDFDPGTRQFDGTYREVTEVTQGACENFTFTRTFDPDEGRFVASLDPTTGTITAPSDPVDIVVNVDPALVASLVPAATAPAANALTAILDEIAAGHEPITATGAAVPPTSDGGVTVLANSFSVVFNPIGGVVAVTGTQEVQTTLTVDGQTCTLVTRATVTGTGRYDPVAGTIVGTSQVGFEREVIDCDITVDPSPDRTGTIELAVDTASGTVDGPVAPGFQVSATFDPASVPPAPDAQFQVDSLAYAFDADVLTISIDWGEPWPPRMVDALLLGGEVVTDDGPVVFGVRYDSGVSSTFMEPDGAYTAFVDTSGNAVLQVEVPGLETVGGPIIRVMTWYAETPGDAGTLVATFEDTVDPSGAPLAGAPEVQLPLPFGLTGFWEGQEAPVTDPAGTEPEPTVAVSEPTDEVVADEATGDPATPDPAATSGGGGGGFPWLVLIPIVAVLVGIALVAWTRWIRPVPPPGPGGEEPDAGGCDELERRWRDAQRDCDRESERAGELSREFDAAQDRARRAGDELAGLPSEETRVELPDGTTISELDLELRRRSAGAAWEAYLADPSPETAHAAEDAWNEQATPEWREEQRRLHHEERDRRADDAAEARAERDRVGTDLAAARRAQREACDRAAEVKRRLDECRAAEAAAPPPAESPVPEPPPPEPAGEPAPAPSPEPVPTAGPPPGGAGPPPGGQPGERPCEDGEERWVEFDGPHTFQLAADDQVAVSVQLIAGTRRFDHLGSLDRSGFVVLDDRGRAASIPLASLAELTPAEIEGAFGGPGGLSSIWETVGSGAVQQLGITLAVKVRRAMVVCDRKERCVDGAWVTTDQRRSRTSGPVETETARATVLGNVRPGLGRTEEDYLAEVVALFVSVQTRARQLIDQAETYRRYQRGCEGGRRG